MIWNYWKRLYLFLPAHECKTWFAYFLEHNDKKESQAKRSDPTVMGSLVINIYVYNHHERTIKK